VTQGKDSRQVLLTPDRAWVRACFAPASLGDLRKGSEAEHSQSKNMSQHTPNQRYQAYLESEHWKNLRWGCFVRDGKRCCHCNSKKNLNAHHLNYRNLTDCYLSDVMTLCRGCHDAIHLHMGTNGIPHNVLTRADVLVVLGEVRNLNNRPKKTEASKGHKVHLSKSERRSKALGELGGVFPPSGPGPFALSRPMLEMFRSDSGVFVGSVVNALGVRYPLKDGWLEKLVGKVVEKDQLLHLFRVRNQTAPKTTKEQKIAKKAEAKRERKRLRKERRRSRSQLEARTILKVDFAA
jgi:hypothetical protein